MRSTDFPSIVSPTSLGRAKGGRALKKRVKPVIAAVIRASSPEMGELGKAMLGASLHAMGALNQVANRLRKKP